MFSLILCPLTRVTGLVELLKARRNLSPQVKEKVKVRSKHNAENLVARN